MKQDKIQKLLLLLTFAAIALMVGCLATLGQEQAMPGSQPMVSRVPLTVPSAPPPALTAVAPIPALGPTVPPSPIATATPTAPPSPTPTLTPSPTPTLPPMQRILLLGTDEREDYGGTWHTDAIMVMTVDAENKRMGMLGIPRDLRVSVPNMGERKINQVDYLGELIEYPGGGPALLAETLKDAFGLEIDHYVRFKEKGFVQAIDAVGGITVTLKCPLQEFAPADPGSDELYKELYLDAGPQWLDGETALKFVTYRYRFGDWGRAKRQQLLLLALRKQALQLDIIPKIPRLWDIVKDSMQSDLTLMDWVRLAHLAMQIAPKDIHGRVIDETMTDDYVTEEGPTSDLVPQMDEIKEVIDTIFDVAAVEEFYDQSGYCPPIWPSPTPTVTPESGQ